MARYSPPCPFVCLFCHLRSLRPEPPSLRQTRPYTRPSIAPKPILDIKHIRNNPGLYAQNCIDRNYAPQSTNAWKILELVQERARLKNAVKSLRERGNVVRRRIEELQLAGRAGPPRDDNDDDDDDGDGGGGAALRALQSEAKELKATLGASAEGERRVEEQIEELALALPNLSSAHTPSGSVPEVLEVVPGRSGSVSGVGRSHVDIGVELDLLDFAGAAVTTGWGWYYLKNEAVLLEQALVQYAYSVCLGRGWKLVAPPSIVYSHIAAACGFQPRDQNDEQQIYGIQQAEKDKAKPPLSLAATAEIPLAGVNAGRTLQEQDLPLKTVAASRCYRAEAGARGVDTKGLYRVHEFTKVEMFAWTMPDDRGDDNLGNSGVSQSQAVFDEMLEIQIEILKALGLGFRVLEMPSTDLGASASRKKDIEAYFPSRTKKDDGYGEVTSASICTDYQSRRLATRVKNGTGQLDWPHTVNGTALAVPRVLAAIMETGWDESDGTVLVPEVLRPWMGGMERIGNISVATFR